MTAVIVLLSLITHCVHGRGYVGVQRDSQLCLYGGCFNTPLDS